METRRRVLSGVMTIGLAVLPCCGGDDDGAERRSEPAAPATPATPATAAAPGTSIADHWEPSPGTTWQWQLEGELDLTFDVEVYDIDLFDTPAETIATLHADGRQVICYYSAGSWEEWRDDADRFAPEALGSTLDGWEDERWLDVTHPSVREVMSERLDLAAAKGCDGVEPDNVDAHDNDTGLSLTRDEQLDYNRWTADEAHARGLAVGLKNALGLIPDLVISYDFAVNEECWYYGECDELTPFVDAGKAVFHVEYEQAFVDEGGCADTTALGFSSLFLPLDLDGSFRTEC